MDTYEVMLQDAVQHGYRVIENCIFSSDAKGLVVGNKIGLSSSLQTSAEKACVLAEEIAHAELTATDITDMSRWQSRHEEIKARRLSHDKLIGIRGLLDAYRFGCQSRHEAAEFLGVTEDFLQAAVDGYIARYGPVIVDGDYVITLNPIGVLGKC